MLDSNKCTNFNKKSHFKAFFFVSYDFMIRTLYRMIYEYFQYIDMIRNFLHTIRYVLCIIRYWQLWMEVVILMTTDDGRLVVTVVATRVVVWDVSFCVTHYMYSCNIISYGFRPLQVWDTLSYVRCCIQKLYIMVWHILKKNNNPTQLVKTNGIILLDGKAIGHCWYSPLVE